MKAYPVKFFPIPQERIWGGNQLKEWFDVRTSKPIGEYWVLSSHPNAMSVVMNGPLSGKTLVQLTEEFPQDYLGHSPQDRFPLLIKFIEAREDLSVQIHPNDCYAKEVESDFGKTEAWYILEHKPNAKIVYGHTFKNKEEYLRAIAEKQVPYFLQTKEITKDELIFVPAQTLHALLSGTILIEIQQTSDITYRVYDWERVDKNGKSRELHIDKAADVMIYDNSNPLATQSNQERFFISKTSTMKHEHLLTCPYFSIEKLLIKNGGCDLSLGKKGNPDILIVAEGSGVLETDTNSENLELRRGDTILIPSTCNGYHIHTKEQLSLLRTFY
ncbi:MULTISPECIES: type I phosphomannose isomerase catalytic subunit [Aneurinibacillus]|uniref:Mannose-6-phosphate isomerase n=1 Tax=Aneurinibacillus thermoaerophilus TaxID=143495 RepID=A0A1G7XAX3_ANETH|nr:MULTISPECIES: type I phosphomannose isomerase catalytic subunit [Aneurinibacillus]AMA73287.1 mannose-6-phosphate isomerase [Aneurinibacillus sp. XH2]MED0674273.1 class I mannose-6-phosphate isomerase [Aneurinibacillus thermoaerophilus]MED0736183.1 class I mannose-6-phosphate isomerase [Aneurinibacillus thermoaerophilus]MED0757029.1 class I mannose-6-phosphate isomerase [Aneurinibacillus thermoaerophilus]MED0761666.1 class I mannose-6-phosphate isomerase [Aneurinibacillus thermoaerophilus]